MGGYGWEIQNERENRRGKKGESESGVAYAEIEGEAKKKEDVARG